MKTRICINTRTVPVEAIHDSHPASQFRGGKYCRRRPSKKCPDSCEFKLPPTE
jgi:hypothetical protein